jgi:phosphoglycerate dehydrogenase-like enzyme
MPTVLITPIVYQNGIGPWRSILDAAGFQLRFPDGDCVGMDRESFLRELQGVDGTLASVETYSEEVLRRSGIKVVARVGVGYDAIDLDAATRHGVVVSITPGTNEHSVAEQAIALLTAVFRDVARRDREIRAGIWRRDCPRRLAGNTIGLVGLGRIGKAMVPRCRGLGLNILAYDPFPDREFAQKHDVELVDFDSLLGRSDIVSLHMPCTPETTDLINPQSLAKMRSNSVLINTSRGGLVDEIALIDALHRGHLYGAGLDVCKVEPLPADSPLRNCPNIVFAPHLGGIDQQALDAMGELAARCLVDLLSGRWPDACVVNRAVRPHWQQRLHP